MLLDDLVTAIQTVQTRIRDHGSSLSQNEYRTRISLIDPVLNALGWDVSDPNLVMIEDHHSGVGTPDYALLGKDGRPRAYIEAKKLGEMAGTTKPAHRSQLRDYADELKTNYAGLTDGNHWIFRDFSSGFSGESYILDITLSNQTAYQCALKLLVLWRPNLGTGQPTEANEPIVENGRDDPTPLPLGRVSLADFDPKTGKPVNIQLPGKQEMPIANWHEILGQTAQWLIDTEKLTKAMCPVKAIVNSKPESENGAQFRQYGKLTKGLFFNKHGSRQDTVARTRYLVRHCGQDPASILLKPSE